MKNSSPKIKSLSKKDTAIIQFEPSVCYSLNPEEYSDLSIGFDVASTFFHNNFHIWVLFHTP